MIDDKQELKINRWQIKMEMFIFLILINTFTYSIFQFIFHDKISTFHLHMIQRKHNFFFFFFQVFLFVPVNWLQTLSNSIVSLLDFSQTFTQNSPWTPWTPWTIITLEHISLQIYNLIDNQSKLLFQCFLSLSP